MSAAMPETIREVMTAAANEITEIVGSVIK